MSLFAVASATLTAADRLRQIPSNFWVTLAVGVCAIFAIVLVVRKVAGTNKLFLGFSVFLFATFIGVNWIHERNEPKWATPAVQVLSGFFPGKVEAKPTRLPGK